MEDNDFDLFHYFCMTYHHYVGVFLLDKNHVCLNFELKQKNFYSSSTYWPWGKGSFDPTGEEFDMSHYLN